METERLCVRRFKEDDFQDFCNLIIDKMDSPLSIYDEQFITNENALKAYLEYCITSEEYFAIELKEKTKLIGFITLNYINDEKRNLGYLIHSDYQNMGYAMEACTRIKQYCIEELKLTKLVTGTAEVNVASMKLLEKLGFVVISKETATFAKDENGKNIEFIACNLECDLTK